TLAQFVNWSVSAGTNRTDYAETWNGSNRVARAARVYFTNGTDVLLGQLIQGENPNALTHTYTYYPASSRVRQIDEPDGRWQIFHYDAQGRVTHQFEPWTNSAPTTNAAGCRVTEYGYSLAAAGDDGVYQPELPRQTVVKIQGQEVRRRYTALTLDADGRLEGRIDKECPNPGAGWADASNEVTATDYLTEGEFRGRVWRRGNPDGTWTFLNYSQGATNFTTTETTGQPNGSTNGIVNGTVTVTTLGSAGQVLSRCVTNVADGTPGLMLEREVYTYTDALNRSYRVVTLDGRTNQVQRGCCGTDTFTDKDGSAVTQAYDGLKRGVARTQHGITETNQLDGAGRVLARASLGANGVSIERERNGYDEVGRWIARTNALGGVTVWAEGMTNDYTRRFRIATDEGGGQRIEWYCRDGRLEKVTGSAAAPVVYEYGWGWIDGYAREYRKETALDANGQETGQWTRSYFDGLGREIKTVYADETTGTETDNPARQRVYDAHGQLAREVDPDGVTTLYEYDGQGQLLQQALDLNRDGTMDLDGPDRITTTVRDVVNYGFVPVVRTRTYAHTANGSSQTGLVSTVLISTDGLTRWSIMPVEGGGEAVTLAVTSYGAGGQRSETTTEPDGSTWERSFSYGRLTSLTRKDASAAQLSQVTYGYDAYGRVSTVTDARNGTTT
ncbi:MAG TPA: RHS repeat protein, partial [Verrucomicrobiota bacterium]|nr:RHS repeat protein [Verrucomicrobiota bacterium]